MAYEAKIYIDQFDKLKKYIDGLIDIPKNLQDDIISAKILIRAQKEELIGNYEYDEAADPIKLRELLETLSDEISQPNRFQEFASMIDSLINEGIE